MSHRRVKEQRGIMGLGGSNLGVEGVRSRRGQPTVTWWYILVAAESNGLNLSLGLTLTHSAVLPTHTEPRPTRETRSAASAVRLPEFQSWLRGEPARPARREDTSTRVFSPESKPRLGVCLPSEKKRDFLEGFCCFFLEGGEKRTDVKTQHGS